MNKVERTLLESILDSLDRLFDRENRVADVYSLLFAVTAALAESEHAAILGPAAEKTKSALRSPMPPEQKRDAAIASTEELRKYLSDVLYRDSPLRI